MPHEIQKVQLLADDDLRSLIDEELIFAHRTRALTSDRPVLRGTAQNPDVYFQARERANPYYNACAEIVQQVMDKFGERTGRHYQIYEYYGANDADRVIVLMDGSNVLTTVAADAPSGAWVPSISDTNGDGKTDIFWRNYETGENAVVIVTGTDSTPTALPTLGKEWYTM